MERTAFMHVPKAGGTSIYMILRGAFGKQHVALNHSLHFGNASIVCGHFSYRPHNKRYIWLSFVRHPIARLQSFYFYVDGKGKTRTSYWERLIQHKSLEEWLECPESKNHMTKMFAGKTHMDTLERGDLRLAKENVDKFLFIGRQENFNKDIVQMLEIIGAPTIPKILHINKSKNPPNILYPGVYGNEADLELYDYISRKNYL